ncbi:MAG: hypothetical protein KGR98_01970 [Verrucomicrobia bacterium]|nr:hypothetical protein [Verrucomicrobiota bacterium]MDE3100101.1 hypothetical protein [Verrucomicrobiota bacterium]
MNKAKRFQKSRAGMMLAMLVCAAGAPAWSAPLELQSSVPLNVSGRIDHIAVDLAGKRLFICALGQDAVEVVDLMARRAVKSISGFSEPQGVVYVDGRLFVANGGDGTLRVLDGHSFKTISTMAFGEDADNMRYDAQAGLVCAGHGRGGLALIRAGDAREIGDIALDGHPEAFELEPNGSRVFVNVPDAAEIEVADRRLQKVIAKWPMEKFRGNFPMALDQKDDRLFVGCRGSNRLVVLDAVSGREVSDLPVSGDNDDLFYDPARRRVYASCGRGFLDVFAQQDGDHYRRMAHIPTARGARTSLFVPQLDALYLAAPRRAGQTAALWIYKVK